MNVAALRNALLVRNQEGVFVFKLLVHNILNRPFIATGAPQSKLTRSEMVIKYAGCAETSENFESAINSYSRFNRYNQNHEDSQITYMPPQIGSHRYPFGSLTGDKNSGAQKAEQHTKQSLNVEFPSAFQSTLGGRDLGVYAMKWRLARYIDQIARQHDHQHGQAITAATS